MPGGYGSSKNGVRLGVFWDGIEYSSDGSQGRITDAHINIDRDVNISDSTNSLSWGGAAVADGSASNINVSGSGEKRIKSCSETWVDLNYGSTKTATFSASMSKVDYAGGTLSVSKTITFNARPYGLPAAPTLTAPGAMRVDTSSQKIRAEWVNNPVLPAAPYTAVFVERTDNGGAWTNVSGDLPPTTPSWDDSTTVANHYYQYRVVAKNSSGNSPASAASSIVATTPSAPSSFKVVKTGSNISASWSNAGTAYFTGTRIKVRHGTAWTTYTVPNTATTWDDPDENTSVVQQYVIDHFTSAVPVVSGPTFTDYSTALTSPEVQLEAPPLDPTVSVSQSVLDVSDTAQVISWEHNPVDASAQTQADVRWRVLPSGAYTTEYKTTQSSHTIPAGSEALANNNTYGVQVRTRGAHATFGPWSTEITFSTSTKPQVAVTSPVAGSVLDTAALLLTLSYSDPGGAASASAWQIQLSKTGELSPWLVWPEDSESTLPGSISDAQYTLPYPLEDGVAYSLQVRAQDAAGLWSEWVEYTYSVVFSEPFPGTIIDTACDPETGEVRIRYIVDTEESLSIYGYGGGPYGEGGYGGSDYDPGEGLLPAVGAVVQRLTDGAWVDVCDNDFSGSMVSPGVWECVDPIAPLGIEVRYRVVTRSAIPTFHEGTEFVADCMLPTNSCYYPDGMRIFLNAGPGWTTRAVIIGDPAVSEPVEREKVLVTPVGRVYPVELIGIAVDEKYSLSGVVARDSIVPTYLAKLGALREDWAAMAQMPAPICYRDPFGKRIFGSISEVKTDWGTTPVSSVSATITRTGGGES